MRRRAAEGIAAGLLLAMCLVGCDAKKSAPPEARGEGVMQEPVVSGGDFVLKKLDSIVIPSANFEDTSIEDAVEYVRMRIMELDPDPDASRKGISFVIRAPAMSICGGFPNSDDLLEGKLSLGEDRPKRINLREKNISAADLLVKCADQVGLDFYLTSRGWLMLPEGELPDQDVEIWKAYRQTKK